MRIKFAQNYYSNAISVLINTKCIYLIVNLMFYKYVLALNLKILETLLKRLFNFKIVNFKITTF